MTVEVVSFPCVPGDEMESWVSPKKPQKPVKKQDLIPIDCQGANVQKVLFPITEAEVDGIGMGVLSDGTPFLTLRGLARICGVAYQSLQRLANNWEDEKLKPRGVKITELLGLQGHDGTVLQLHTSKNDVEMHAYTDAVCMALLEYYAFEVKDDNGIAMKNYRLLARHSIREFIYNRCGYDPERHIPDSWKNFHARVLLNDHIPADYFSVFRELADIVIHMIQANCPIDDHTVPDISVGTRWARFWCDNDFDSQFGLRTKHPHIYPDWYPQSNAGPQDAWIYPVTALGKFRVWLYSNYIPESFPTYIANKVRQGAFLPSHAQLIIASVENRPLIGIEEKPK